MSLLRTQDIGLPWRAVPLVELPITRPPAFTISSTICLWRWSHDLAGAFVFGAPDVATMDASDDAIYTMFERAPGPMRILHDMSGMCERDFTGPVLSRVKRTGTAAPLFAKRKLGRLAFVVGFDWVQTFWHGTRATTQLAATPVTVVSAREHAYRWLDVDDDAARVIDAFDVLADSDALFERTVRWLDAHPHGDLKAAAAALGTSARSLQRELATRGTTFIDLRTQRRLVLARRMLVEVRDLKVDAVASEVGFRSLSQFYESFRRVVGVSPAEFRRTAGLRVREGASADGA